MNVCMNNYIRIKSLKNQKHILINISLTKHKNTIPFIINKIKIIVL